MMNAKVFLVYHNTIIEDIMIQYISFEEACATLALDHKITYCLFLPTKASFDVHVQFFCP